MKKIFFNRSVQYSISKAASLMRSTSLKNLRSSAYVVAITAVFLIAGCKKHDTNECKGLGSIPEFTGSVKGLPSTTLCELQQAREATEKYKQISAAYADQYEDISVVLPNMGQHFMKKSSVNATFEISKPEILVYNKNHDDVFELVAVEYAVPIDITPNAAPEGFTGSADVWNRNTDFGLWLLHAWVWKPNPAGVFNPTNPGVHVHI